MNNELYSLEFQGTVGKVKVSDKAISYTFIEKIVNGNDRYLVVAVSKSLSNQLHNVGDVLAGSGWVSTWAYQGKSYWKVVATTIEKK